MERECRTCGRLYRGLVCQACHPRKTKGTEGTGGTGGATATGKALLAAVPIAEDSSCNDSDERGNDRPEVDQYFSVGFPYDSAARAAA